MLYPSMSELLKKINSRYLLVNVIAKRSRDLADDALKNNEPLQQKPVSIAVNQLANGEYTAYSKKQY